MNSVNSSTDYSGFQLLMGRSLRLILPLLPVTGESLSTEEWHVTELIEWLKCNVEDAKDHLLEAKCLQGFYANWDRFPKDSFKIGDHVILSTLHCQWEFMAGDPSCVTKFIPWFDGPYKIINNMPKFSAYTLELPNSPNIFPTFHTSQLKCFTKNNTLLFPLYEHISPSLIMTSDGMEEYMIDRIIDKWHRGRGHQYLVHWVGYGPEEEQWLLHHKLDNCEALDTWQKREGAIAWW